MNQITLRGSCAVLLVFLLASPALPLFGAIGTLDNVPAATLLLPYFEVSLDDPNGINTVLSLQNASATAVLAHVTLWTDLARPTYSFNVYLTGYDSTMLDLRLLFEGIIPQTASDGQDPDDTISPQGDISQDINFASCGELPQDRLTTAQQLHLRQAHTGGASALWGGMCGGVAHGDTHARGYITIDTVNACNSLFPSDGVAYRPFLTQQNIIFGEYVFIERTQRMAYGDHLVAVEAAFLTPYPPEVSDPGRHTFYGRYLGYDATDRREPLATNWRARFTSAPATDAIVWRDAGSAGGSAPFACGAIPAPYPLPANEVEAFDEQEDVANLGHPASFPYATNRVPVNGPALLTPFSSGFLALNLNVSLGDPGGPPSAPYARQSYVTILQRVPASTGTLWSGFPLDSATAPANFLLIP